MANRRHLEFSKFQIFKGRNGQKGQTASSCRISSKSLEPWPRYSDFSISPRRRPSAILDLWCVCWDHPRMAFGGLYHCAKFGWNQCGSLNFGLAYSRPNFFLGGWPLKFEAILKKPKRHILARVRAVWAIMRENPSTGLTCRWVPKMVYRISSNRSRVSNTSLVFNTSRGSDFICSNRSRVSNTSRVSNESRGV